MLEKCKLGGHNIEQSIAFTNEVMSRLFNFFRIDSRQTSRFRQVCRLSDVYLSIRRRLRASTPTSPPPSSSMVDGSGIGF